MNANINKDMGWRMRLTVEQFKEISTKVLERALKDQDAGIEIHGVFNGSTHFMAIHYVADDGNVHYVNIASSNDKVSINYQQS